MTSVRKGALLYIVTMYGKKGRVCGLFCFVFWVYSSANRMSIAAHCARVAVP